MASPLFRIHDSELAVWKTGSNEIVGPKWRCRKTSLLLGVGDGGRELGTELLFSQKIAQVLVEADQRAHSVKVL
jgi:hypothetical protein